MRSIALIASLIALSNLVIGQTTDFKNQPWVNGYPIVLDAYRLNGIDYEKLRNTQKVTAIIYKASHGLTADVKYKKSIQTAQANGFLVASYHLGTNIDPIKQADFYLAQIGEGKNQPMALDIEAIGGNNISLPDAEKFIKRIHEKTGKYPLIYVNNAVFESINKRYDANSVFAKCGLWYARFLNTLPNLSTRVWNKVTLWQFACEINCQVCAQKDAKGNCIRREPRYTLNCPFRVDGTLYDIDINAFNGTTSNLTSFWNSFN
jgi:GH25 family lysozyme M1 (1,4-beta-N-acetylmuramidase)